MPTIRPRRICTRRHTELALVSTKLPRRRREQAQRGKRESSYETADGEHDRPENVAPPLHALLLPRQTLEHAALLLQPLGGVDRLFEPREVRKKGDVSTVEEEEERALEGDAKYVLALSLEQFVQVLEGDVLDLVGLGLHGSDLVNVLVVREPILEGKEGESDDVLYRSRSDLKNLRSRMVLRDVGCEVVPAGPPRTS